MPAWDPQSEDVFCAKFLYFYEKECFVPRELELKAKIKNLRGKKRLQGKGLSKTTSR
jgi:hypothetical protein